MRMDIHTAETPQETEKVCKIPEGLEPHQPDAKRVWQKAVELIGTKQQNKNLLPVWITVK